MSTELKLTLNVEAYYAELEKVIQTAKQSSVLRIFYLRIKNAKEQKLRFALSL